MIPSIWRRALNYAVAVSRHAKDGFAILPDREIAARLAVCVDCDRFEEREGRPICGDARCGCFLVKKAGWRSEDCPQGKWPPVETS